MTLSAIDRFYLDQQEPVKSCLMALRSIILKQDRGITFAWRYRMPFFYFKGKMFCYLWVDRKTRQPYLGIVEGRRIKHPALVAGNRTRMKVLYIDPLRDLPLQTIEHILQQAMKFYK